MKIEELNAHISTLYVENLRLRASEIALQSQLKREKVKSHKIMADAEAAVSTPLITSCCVPPSGVAGTPPATYASPETKTWC